VNIPLKLKVSLSGPPAGAHAGVEWAEKGGQPPGRFMKPMELLKLAYETFGAKHPTGSLIIVMALGGVMGVAICGALWTVAANQYQKGNATEPARTVNTTTGPQSPIMPNNNGSVTISNDNSKPKQPPPKDKSK